MRINITSQEQEQLREYVLDLTGIDLDEGKGYLFEYRLSPLLEEHKLVNYNELYYKAKEDQRVREQIISAITTNETSFFRDGLPFDLMVQLVQELIHHKQARGQERPSLRIWSAACSYGQEVYSIAMLLKENFNLQRYDVQILGTDISQKALEYAEKGLYNKVELSRGINMTRLNRYFTQVDKHYQISDELRQLTRFRKINLTDPNLGVGTFDLVFCRNVAVYFKLEERERMFERMARFLEPRGKLIIGSTETMTCDAYIKHIVPKGIYYEVIDPIHNHRG